MTRFFRCITVWLLTSLPLTAWPAKPPPSAPEWQTPDENDLRMLEVRVDHHPLDEILLAYQQGDGLVLPLGMLGEMLGIAIATTPEEGTASGFILDPERRFFLDTRRAEVTLAGERATYDPSKVAIFPDDIYVESTLLQQWLPLRFDIDLYALQLRILPTRPLPMQQRMAREKRIRHARGKLAPEAPRLPRHDEPYRLWSPPFIDATIGLSHQGGNDDQAWGYRYAIHATGDLLRMGSSLYLAGDDDQPGRDARLTLDRTDPDGGLLGPLRATRVAIGHIGFPAVPLITPRGDPLPGITIGSLPLYRQSLYDRHDFEGALPDGWDVELYRNNVLIDYQPAPVDGRYRFDNIPLLLGHNFFRLLFHGPRGEQREERRHFILGDTLTRPGTHHYRMVLSDAGDGDTQALLQFDHGLTHRLSSRLALVRLPLDNGQERLYHSAGLYGFAHSLYGGIDVTRSDTGTAWQASAQWRLGPFNLSARQIHLDDFLSPAFADADDPLRLSQHLQLDTRIPLLHQTPATLRLGVGRQRTLSGAERLRIDQRLALRIGHLMITNTLSQQSGTSATTIQSGELTFSGRTHRIGFRGQMQYRLSPEREPTRLSASFELGKFRSMGVSLQLHHAMEQHRSRIRLALRHESDRRLLTLGGEIDSGGGYRLTLEWRGSLGRQPLAGNWFSSSRPLAGSALVAAEVFLDRDQNNRWDKGEEALSGVQFALGPGQRVLPAATDESGVVLLDRLLPYKPIDIAIADFSLDDPLWMPATEGWSVIPRPGHPARLRFAVVPGGEIDGTIYLRNPAGDKAVGKVIVQAVDADGHVVKQTESAFDGFYLLSGLPLGDYRVRIDPRQLQTLGLSAEPAGTIGLTFDAPISSGVDFMLRIDDDRENHAPASTRQRRDATKRSMGDKGRTSSP